MQPTITLGGDVFTLSLLGFEETCDLQPIVAPLLGDIGRLFALAIGEASKLDMSTGDLAEADVLTLLPKLGGALGDAGDILASIARKLPAESLRTLRRTLLQGATMNGKPLYPTVEGGPVMINVLMQGRTLDGWRLLLFALKENYPDFFALLRPVVAGGKDSVSNSATSKAGGGPAGA